MKTYCRAFIHDGQISHLATSDHPMGDEVGLSDDSGSLEYIDFEHEQDALCRARDLIPRLSLRRRRSGYEIAIGG